MSMTETNADSAVKADVRKPVLEVDNVVKRFGVVTALNHVSLNLYEGEILALLGDNGAGKSTLVKVLSGVHAHDEGEIRLDGVPVSLNSPAEARRSGIETVYQDLALFDNMSAASNFYAGREIANPSWLGGLSILNRRRMRQRASRALDRLGMRIHDADTLCGLMSGGQRQAVAVARAEAFAKRIVILDEPTAALGVRESRAVLDLIRRLPESGKSVILISHNLEHVQEIADRAVVFRQGRKVGEEIPSAATHERIVSLIVGGGEEKPESVATD